MPKFEWYLAQKSFQQEEKSLWSINKKFYPVFLLFSLCCMKLCKQWITSLNVNNKIPVLIKKYFDTSKEICFQILCQALYDLYHAITQIKIWDSRCLSSMHLIIIGLEYILKNSYPYHRDKNSYKRVKSFLWALPNLFLTY